MTENEAIEVLKDNFPKTCKMVDGRLKGGFDDVECDFGNALLQAISSLKEIQKYRAIGTIEFLTDMKSNYVEVLSDLRQYQKVGTVEECREAREMTRKYCEPKYLGENIAIGCRDGECRCGNIVRSYQKFCDQCGIGLDWGNVTAWQQLPEPYRKDGII